MAVEDEKQTKETQTKVTTEIPVSEFEIPAAQHTGYEYPDDLGGEGTVGAGGLIH